MQFTAICDHRPTDTIETVIIFLVVEVVFLPGHPLTPATEDKAVHVRVATLRVGRLQRGDPRPKAGSISDSIVRCIGGGIDSSATFRGPEKQSKAERNGYEVHVRVATHRL